MDLNGKDGNKARPLCDIMVKAEQAIPQELAQRAGVRNFTPADMGEIMRPAADGGMLNPEAARAHAAAGPPPSSGAVYGGYSRQPGDAGATNEEQVAPARRKKVGACLHCRGGRSSS